MSDTNPSMPMFTPSAGMMLLWRESARRLKPHELRWLSSGIADQVEADADAYSKMLMGIGNMITAEEPPGILEDKHEVQDLLFHLSRQFNTISGLIHIADDARFLAQQASEGAKP